MRPDEIKFLYPNINKISKRYKWRAKKTLSQGLIETINHYKKILN